MFRRELPIGFMSKDIRRWSRHIKTLLACRKSGGDIGESKLHETLPEWRDVIDPGKAYVSRRCRHALMVDMPGVIGGSLK
jgi:hypothetical protein